MARPLEDLVVDFYVDLFTCFFYEPVAPHISGRRKQNAVKNQLVETAGAAALSLARFCEGQRWDEKLTAGLLDALKPLAELLDRETVANPNIAPESVVAEVIGNVKWPQVKKGSEREAAFRVALHSVVQAVMLVGPIFAEWQKASFSERFEQLDRVRERLDRISTQLGVGAQGKENDDERFELQYRDYLAQRFFRTDTGTIKMSTGANVDIRELFVMPRVRVRPDLEKCAEQGGISAAELMGLAKAREFFDKKEEKPDAEKLPMAIERVKAASRLVLVGAPGGGKSTFFDWLQLRVAEGEEPLILGGQQAIPVLLRVRQLDAHNLPGGRTLIEKATASKELARLMPEDWIDRQMKAGRVILLVDGLDEVEPELRDTLVIPWLLRLCKDFLECAFLVSSRPVGYPPGSLRKAGFEECDLADFDELEVGEYCRHWCTAVRLAQNEPQAEARTEGEKEGNGIVEGFKTHPYIRNLARNPLMLSAICLINYFEKGKLPRDRASLYQLCVEGMIHNWDQRRGIQSEFGLAEKLRVCREAALAMQNDGLAEYEEKQILAIFERVLGNKERAERLLRHIRRRTGLLLERRPGVYAFAHLTFQEYLAASAVHEGNCLQIGVAELVKEHGDGRWKEVIALYCGLAPAPTARVMIESLIAAEDTDELSKVLAEAFLISRQELQEDVVLTERVIRRICVCQGMSALARFPVASVASIANECVGLSTTRFSESLMWLVIHVDHIEWSRLIERVSSCDESSRLNISEIATLVHACAPLPTVEAFVEAKPQIYSWKASTFISYQSIAELALAMRIGELETSSKSLMPILKALAAQGEFGDQFHQAPLFPQNVKVRFAAIPGDTSISHLMTLANDLATRLFALNKKSHVAKWLQLLVKHLKGIDTH